MQSLFVRHSKVAMPFVQLDFSTDEAALALQLNLNQQLKLLKKPSSILSKLLFVNLPGVVPIPWFKRVLYFLQATVLFVVYFGFLTLALFELAQFWTTKPTAIQIALMVYRFQTLFSFMGLFFWYFNLGDLKLKEYILNSSNGVGIVKNSSKLKICNLISLFYGLARSAFYLAIFGYFHSPFSKAETETESLLFLVKLGPLLFLSYQFLSIGVFYSVCTYSMLSIGAEFDGLNDDFNNDQNVFQLPVIRHYIYAHSQILQIFCRFRFFYSNVVSGHIICGFGSCLTFLVVNSFSKDSDYQHLFNILNVIMFVENAVSVFIILIPIIALNNSVIKFADETLMLLASNRVLQEEVSSTIIGYSTFLKTSTTCGLYFFNLKLMDKSFVFKLLEILSFVLTIYLFFKML